MEKQTITGRIYTKALEFLEEYPEGIHWSELISMIQASDPTIHPKTLNGCIWKLVGKFPEKVYKPEKGLFRLVKYRQ